jgi:hypothetical protein
MTTVVFRLGEEAFRLVWRDKSELSSDARDALAGAETLTGDSNRRQLSCSRTVAIELKQWFSTQALSAVLESQVVRNRDRVRACRGAAMAIERALG